MNTTKRNGNKWTVNEELALQREYELLGWDIDTIANKHQRTAKSIMYKLSSEGLADYKTISTNYYDGLNLKPSLDTINDANDNITNRVETLEHGLNEIKSMIQQLMNSSPKRKQSIYA